MGEFCHGLNAKQLKKRMWRNISLIGDPDTLSSYSIDGSKFDSTQHQEIIEVVDDRFWNMYRPRLRLILEKINQEWHWNMKID